MHILLYFVVVVHILVCLFLIGVVLLQQGRSADLAGAFGGQGSQTAFGPRAAANVLTRLTTWSAVIFMVTSITLTILYDRTTASHSVLSGTKTAPISAPAKPRSKPLAARVLKGGPIWHPPFFMPAHLLNISCAGVRRTSAPKEKREKRVFL